MLLPVVGVIVRVGVAVAGTEVLVGVLVGPPGVLVLVDVLVGMTGVFVRVMVGVRVGAPVQMSVIEATLAL